MNHPLTRLVARYGHEHGHYLFGEYCVLQHLGLDAFLMRHTEQQVQRIAGELGAVGLWPEGASSDWTIPRVEGQRILEQTAASLLLPPLRLGLGSELLRECLKWAVSQGLDRTQLGRWFEAARVSISQDLGFPLPALMVVLDPLHNHSLGYTLYAAGQVLCRGEAFPGQDCVLLPSGTPFPPGFSYEWLNDPCGEGLIGWMPVGPCAEPPVDLERLHWLQALSRHVEVSLRQNAHSLLGGRQVSWLLVEAENAGYDHELERYVSGTELRMVFRAMLQQGLPLKPVRAILETLTTHILDDLAGRSLNPGELERAHRQLPLYPTETLVAVIRQSLGLPDADDAHGVVTPAPGPIPVLQWEPTLAQRQRFEQLIAVMDHQRPVIDFWYDHSRHQPLPWHGLANAEAACQRWCQLESRLGLLGQHLEGHTVAESAGLLALVEERDWTGLRWQLLYPAHLLVTHDLTEAYDAWRQASSARPIHGESA